MRGLSFTLGALLFLAETVVSQNTEFTTCKSNALDWYTSMTGENPCSTYQRLRQICDNSYRVGRQNPSTPPDRCDTQVKDCCCNSVSFTLSMLCLNCQQIDGGDGLDAGQGAYNDYLAGCARPSNGTLPQNIQTAVCRQEPQIRIPDTVQTAFWNTGDWFYTFVRQNAEKEFNIKGNDTFTTCPKPPPTSSSRTTTSSGGPTTAGSTPSAIPTETAESSGTPMGAIVGGAVGGVVAIGIAIAAIFLLRRKKRNQRRFSSNAMAYEIDPDPPAVTPFLHADGSEWGATSQYGQPPSQSGPSSHGDTVSIYPESHAMPPLSTGYMSEKQRRNYENAPRPYPPTSAGEGTFMSHASSGPAAVHEADAGPVRLPPQYDESWLGSEPSESGARSSAPGPSVAGASLGSNEKGRR